MRVLIVDDASMMRYVIKEILSQFCDDVVDSFDEADNGEGAIRKYKNEKADVVFLDISMPGMNGIDVVRELIDHDPDARIIMITASSDQTDVVDCIKAGAIDYIIKPPSPERVVDALHQAYGSYDDGDEEE